MAYTIISQNNSTTTLSDENGNVITVPARVTLATSTDYTITKVNNNSVDLVDGNGKVIRGVPACVVLAGEGGGGGSAVESVNGKTGVVVLDASDVGALAQLETMPTASADNLGDIIQFTGTTDANYTNGYFYKCVSDGQDPATYTWTQVDVQPAGSSLPDQTGQSGKFLMTDGTDASWDSSKLILNGAKYVSTPIDAIVINNYNLTGGTYYSSSNLKDQSILIGGNSNGYPESKGSGAICIGWGTKAGQSSISIGYGSTSTAREAIQIGSGNESTGNYSISMGYKAACDAQAIQLVMSNRNNYRTVNSDANTFKVANANGNYEIMSADGTVPTARLTKVNTTATLAVADWSSNTQTITVSGVKADSVVFVSPAPASASDYASAGILCTAQAANSLTFTCTTTPSNAITVNVICM